jgi:glycosyltransferase involved in cell wall biosynthesis
LTPSDGPRNDLTASSNARGLWASDVGVLARTPFLSGIQRVVLQLHRGLRGRLGPAGLKATEVVPHLAPQEPHPAILADPVTSGPRVLLEECEWLLGLDLNPGWPLRAERLRAARAEGTRILVHVHDVLPATHPEWFPPGAQKGYARWLRTVRDTATVVTVSADATAEALTAWWERRSDGSGRRPPVRVVPLGADVPAGFRRTPSGGRGRPRFLMVGTVEPRKGHADVLDAVDLLWRDGLDVSLTIVGRQGWMVERLARRIRTHPEHGRRLQWHEALLDVDLEEQYATCDAVLVASYGEGFGLPIVEAAAREIPLVVRDLPVFREIAGPDVAYFAGGGPALAERLRAWLAAWRSGAQPSGSTVVRRSWQEVADQLFGVTEQHS